MARMMVQLDDELLAEAQRLTGARTKRAAIETALAEPRWTGTSARALAPSAGLSRGRGSAYPPWIS